MSETDQNKTLENTESKGLDSLKNLQVEQEVKNVTAEPDVKEPKIDDLGRSYSTGRRKESVSYTHLTLPTTPYV